MAKIAQLRRFPLKGGMAVPVQTLWVNQEVGVLDDRKIAVRRNPGDLTKRPEKFNKSDYLACSNTPGMAMEQAELIAAWPAFTASYLERLRSRLQIQGDFQVQDSENKYHLADTDGPQVSFLNLATHEMFEEFIGHKLDPHRWRMNVWASDLPALAELDWVDGYPGSRAIAVGDVRMRVDDLAVRCKAPDANPETGQYDINTMAKLTQFMERHRPGYESAHHRGAKHIMGFYGVMLNRGVIKVGDEIRLL